MVAKSNKKYISKNNKGCGYQDSEKRKRISINWNQLSNSNVVSEMLNCAIIFKICVTSHFTYLTVTILFNTK